MKKFKYLLITLFVLLISFFAINVKADEFVQLIPGEDFNNKIRNIIGCDPVVFFGSNQCDYGPSTFTRSNNLPSNIVDNDDYIISTSNSDSKAYVWVDNNSIYWYSSAQKVYLNENSSQMFQGLRSLSSINLTGFDTSRVTNMATMFAELYQITSLDVSMFDTSNVTNMMAMFLSCTQLQAIDLSNFDTRNVTNYTYMFDSCYALKELNLSSFDSRKSDIDITNMFYNNTSIEKITATKLFEVSSGQNVFLGDTNLVGSHGTRYDNSSGCSYGCDDYSYAHIDEGESNPGYFTGVDTVKVTFEDNVGNSSVLEVAPGNKIDFPNAPPLIMGYDFKGYYTSSAHTTKFDFQNTRLYSDTTIYMWFDPVESVLLPGKQLNYKMKKLAGNDITQDDINNLTDNAMDTNILRIEESENAPVIANMTEDNIVSIEEWPKTYMWFENGTIYWWSEAPKVSFHPDMSYGFFGMQSVESIDIKSINTSYATTMEGLFTVDVKLEEVDLSNFDTSKVTNMNNMFGNCQSMEEIDISSFTKEKLEDVNEMFFSCPNLTRIYANSSFDLRNLENQMPFTIPSTKLEGIMGTKFNDTYEALTTAYAHIDGGESDPGYFTEKVYIKLTYMIDGEKVYERTVLKNEFYAHTAVYEKEGYYFEGWFIDEDLQTPLGNVVRFTEDTTFYAHFEENLKFNIIENIGGTIKVLNNEEKDVSDLGLAPEEEAYIYVKPNDNYTFKKLTITPKTGNPIVIENIGDIPYRLIMMTDVTLEAEYDEKPVITIPDGTDPDDNGTTTITGPDGNPIGNGDHINPGTTITIDVEPKDGYRVTGVEIIDPETGEVIETLTGEPPYEYVVNGPIEVRPIYEELPKINLPDDNSQDNYGTVSVTDTNGNTLNDGDHIDLGTTITINVTPDDNHTVTGIVIKDKDGNQIATSDSVPYNYIVTGDIEIEPIYEEKPVITIPDGTGQDDKGTTTITGPDGNPINNGDHVPEGTTITINVEPKEGYKVVGVEIIDPETGKVIDTLEGEPPYEYVVNGPIEIRPIYEELPKITVPDNTNPDNHGTVSVTDSNGNPVNGYVEPGTPVVIDVKPDDGYEVEKVIIRDKDGNETEITGDKLPYNYIVTGDITIKPVITEKKVEITLPEDNTNGKVTIKDKDGKEITDGKITSGTEIIIDVTPEEGYILEEVLIKDKNGNVIDRIKEVPAKYKVTEPITIEPVYKSKYEITSGDNQTYVKGSNKEIVITCNGALEDLQSIEIDNGNIVDASNYKLESGSTILTLKTNFLENSSVGKHTITFNYKDGSADATLNITDKEESVVPTPLTGDSIILYVIIGVVSLIVMISAIIFIKKRTK